MEYFVLVESPAPRSVKTNKLKLKFIGRKEWLSEGIVQHKTQSGYMFVSSPELTALDLCAYADTYGINRVVSVLQELVQGIKPIALEKVAKLYSNTTAIQRLGYLLNSVFSEEKSANALWKVLSERKFYPVPLSSQKVKKGETQSRWKVIKNMEIESDL
jgi:predicted transcriptional regulator of viral defense system